jgi:hypothetical protein
MEAWASKSKPSKVRTKGIFAIFVDIWTRRSSRRATSTEQNMERASRRLRSARAASSSRFSSRSRIARRASRSSIPSSSSAICGGVFFFVITNLRR